MTRAPDPLARVYGYPYPYPYPPADDAVDPPPPRIPAGVTPVLAFGANASRAVLADKLGEDGARTTVLAVDLHDADVVYSAHVSPYGAIPATLHPSPGTVVAARLLLVASVALDRLDATEPNYRRAPFGDVEVAGLGTLAVHAYRSRHGPLLLGDDAVAIDVVAARGRTLPALGQREVQAAVRDLIAPAAHLDDFVLAGARRAEVRARRTRFLRGLAQPAREGPGRG